MHHQSLYNEFWEKQASISSTSQLISQSQSEAQDIRNNITNENSNQVREYNNCLMKKKINIRHWA